VSRLLICGAAGFTNIGDDAILWGMLSQLEEAAGGRDVRVVGGPELGQVVAPFGAAAMSYGDRPELSRAIEEADLVLLGGGGMLYDFGYDARLERFLTDPPDRQWTYELAKIAAAAKVAGKRVMMYALGAGPVFTEAARRAVRFIAEQSDVITVRDRASAEMLTRCGLPATRLHVTADPAVAVSAGSPDTAEAWLHDTGIAALPRPWVAVSLRAWYRFGAAESAREEREDALDQLVRAAAGIVRGVREKLGGTAVLLPLQRMYDDDRVIMSRVVEAAGAEAGAAMVEPALAPPDLVAALARFDIALGMRLHMLVLAVDAGIPFVGLSYAPKVEEFARAAGLGEHLQGIEDIDVGRALASCEALIARSESMRAMIAERGRELRSAAAISAELAASLLDRPAGARRPAAPRVPASATAEGEIRVLMQTRPDYRERPGGDVVQLEEVQRRLTEAGLTVDLTGEEAPDLSAYDLVHTINLDRPEEAYQHCLNALEQGKPVAVSPVHTDMTEFLEWGDTDYWELSDSTQGSPAPQQVPSVDPAEQRQRARRHQQRQAIVDWCTVYLPNAEMDAEYLHKAFGMDLTRTVVVPHGIASMFFEARAERFVEKYGLRDFVISAGRVEKRKNQLALIAALRGTGIPLVVVGQPNPEEYRDLCRRYAEDNVLFLDAMPQDELASAFAAAKVHALVSWFEIPGLVSLEAGAAGCNVVSTDRGSPREYLKDMAWYCDPRSIESIREAVLAAHEAPRSDRLREHIRQHYTWERAAEQTLAGYRLALSLHAQRQEDDRQQAHLEATLRHADWLARLAADREEEARAAMQWARDAEEWGRGWESGYHQLEQKLRDTRGELRGVREEYERVTSRRLYRWSEALAQMGLGVLRALRLKR
jgi:polysaccharide pyruvyl transferase WcaK-like protein/glycosyltransferase involved in cell wall biosynthesis